MNLSDHEEGRSEVESGEGSEAGAADAEPVFAAVQHNYNTRSKGVIPNPSVESVKDKNSDVAPGVGVVAEHNRVDGRDTGYAAKRRGSKSDSSRPARAKDRIVPKPVEHESQETNRRRDAVVDRSGGVAWNIPVSKAKGWTGRSDLSAEQRNATARRRNFDAVATPTERPSPRLFAPERRRAVLGGLGRVPPGASGREVAPGAAVGRASPA